MKEAELRALLRRKECESVEFKPRLLDREEITEYAVGIGNAGGGRLVLGVSDRRPRRILGIEELSEKELGKIRDSVAESAGIHIELELVRTPDGLVLVVEIPSRPRAVPFHTKKGKYLIRHADALRGMRLEELDAVRREAGVELTAIPLDGQPQDLLSPSAFEQLRELMGEVGAPEDLARLPDLDLLRSLGLMSPDGRILLGALLLAGTREAIVAHLPYARWRFLRMVSDTDYDQTEEGISALPVALRRLRELVAANNPIVTIKGWLVHPEFPRYPVLALRELIVNALVHRDYVAPGDVLLKLYPDRLELTNPGGFVGGVTEQNILHHGPAPRYPRLMQALARIRLANAANLGVPRVFRDLLAEGKEPPHYKSSTGAVGVVVLGQDARREFLEIVDRHPGLDVDHLLVLHHLTRHREIAARDAAEICQRSLGLGREILGQLATRWRLVEVGGAGRGRYWRLSRAAYGILEGGLRYDVDRRLSVENAKARVLEALKGGPLSNADVREITQLARQQAARLMASLREEGQVELRGARRGARWVLHQEA
ncbi:MAG: ATP-binding protein [Planctomycetota bacterium]